MQRRIPARRTQPPPRHTSHDIITTRRTRAKKNKDKDAKKAKADKAKEATAAKEPTKPAEKPAKKPVVVQLTLKGEYPEGANTARGVRRVAAFAGHADRAPGRRRRRQERRRRLVEDRGPGPRPREDPRAAGGHRPASQSQQARLCRADHRRRPSILTGHRLHADRHAPFRHVDYSRACGPR